MFQLKPISVGSIPVALEKAERYRLLNQPWMAESVCLDILEADKQNRKAQVILLLAVTDQFGSSPVAAVKKAKQLLANFTDEYDREYYKGIILERQGTNSISKGNADGFYFAYDWLQDAMACYEKAEAIRPAGNDDAILRWNTCARLIMYYKLEPRNEPTVEPQLE